MARIYCLASVLMFCLWTMFAQEPQINFEYGTPEELKGVTKIYILTGPDIGARNNILKTIQKKLRDIVVTESPETAEVVLLFGDITDTRFLGIWDNSSTTTRGRMKGQSQTFGSMTTGSGTYSERSNTTSSSIPRYQKIITGNGLVVKMLGGNNIRLLMDFEDTQKTKLERDPSTNFARAFIKAYKEANRNKKSE